MKPRATTIFCLDDTALSDMMLTERLGRAMAGLDPAPRDWILVHASGEAVERELEGRAIFDRDADEHGQAIEFAVRTWNRKIVATLTEEGVPAVGFHGSDRGLLKWEDGDLKTGNTAWLSDVAAGGAIPVVSTMVEDALGRIRIASVASAARTISASFSNTCVFGLFTRSAVPQGVERLSMADAAPMVASGSETLEELLGGREGLSVYDFHVTRKKSVGKGIPVDEAASGRSGNR